MACELTLTGSLVVGGDCGCGGSGGSGAGPSKIQPLSLGCAGQQYQSIGSTDCAVTVNSPSEFVPLPGAGAGPVSFLFVRSNAPMQIRWGGSIAQVIGGQIVGSVTFAGGEVLQFDVGPNTVSVLFGAGSLMLQQVVDQINAACFTSGLGYAAASLDVSGLRILLTADTKSASYAIQITQPLALVGFPVATTVAGSDPVVVGISGMFLAQFNPPVSDVEVKGVGSVTTLAAG